MALDSSFRRDGSGDAQQADANADDYLRTRLPAIRPSGAGISVTLWDEVPPSVWDGATLSLPATAPTLADDSPES
jgi:hypothetical protein